MKFRKNTKEAFLLIERVFKKHNIRPIYDGGFAAKLYGAYRPLADIDVNLPGWTLSVLAKEFSRYIIFGPKRYKDKNWDLQLLSIRYKGQVVDLCDKESLRIYDSKHKKWIPMIPKNHRSSKVKIFGKTSEVVTEKDLIKYKKLLHRHVDVEDDKEMYEAMDMATHANHPARRSELKK